MKNIPGRLTTVNNFLIHLQQRLCQVVTAELQSQLDEDVTACLHRAYHQRRQSISRRTQARCQRCGTSGAHAFSRNGHRPRQLLTSYGVVRFWLPRVVCACGGSVSVPFSVLQPYQRWWDDMTHQVQRWAQWGVSLRQMQTAMGDTLHTQIGLRKLNTLTHQTTRSVVQELTSVSPVVMLDAIWITLLADTGSTRKDRSQRERPVKAGKKVCVLVALGLYPQSGRWGILGWDIADSESREAWETLLLTLEQRGVYRQRGLELLIHDGGSGLIAALNRMYPHVPHQRCLFHKLRNLRASIHIPAGMPHAQARELRRELLQQLQPIFQAVDTATAVRLRDTFCEQYATTQPNLVATLQRDWDESVAFFRVLKRYPNWPRSALRTTSLLERVNRMLRRLFTAANAYHSPAGLLADVDRVLRPLQLI
jgi:transposase-like protein